MIAILIVSCIDFYQDMSTPSFLVLQAGSGYGSHENIIVETGVNLDDVLEHATPHMPLWLSAQVKVSNSRYVDPSGVNSKSRVAQ